MRCRTIWSLLVVLICSGGGRAIADELGSGLPAELKQELRAPQRLPSGHYVEVRSWNTASETARHMIGHVVADADADGGRAWEALVGKDSVTNGAMLYGPYLTLTSGDYVAFFRIKLLEDAGEDEVAVADAAADYGENILGSRPLTGSDLALNRYVEVPVPFHYRSGPLECRVTWQGYSGVRVARVSLYRLEGGHIDIGADRVPQPVPTGKPNNLTPIHELRPFPDIFPRSAPPAANMVVSDQSKQIKDWQLAIYSLQGIVNRVQPRIYCYVSPPDADWLKWMRQRKWIHGTESVATPEALLKRFRSSIKGMIVTDPAMPASVNVATMLAGLRDGIVVTPKLAKLLDLPVLEDLRGRWKTSVAAYRWAFDNLWPKLNHHVIACSFPSQLALRDYLVENRVFIFWLSGQIDGARPYANPNAEVALMEELLGKMPVNIPVMSYPYAGKDVGIGEGAGVTLFAEFGKYLVGSTDASNLSVHSGIPIQKLKQIAAPPVPKFDPTKIYVSWIISDGDNLPVLSVFNFPQLWHDKLRGQFPIGWTASPSSIMLLPDVMDYYFSTATPNDEWLGAVSGIGYTYPDSYGLRFKPEYRTKVFDGFLDQTATYMKRMDENIIWPMNLSRPETFARYAEKIPFLQAIFPDYGRRVPDYHDATYPTARNVPVFHALTTWQEGDDHEQQIASLVAQIRGVTPKNRPAFMHLFIWNWGAELSALQEVMRQLGPDYVVVRPDHLAALYRQDLAQEKLLVRAPNRISAIEGRPLVFSAVVQNVTDKPLDVALTIPDGLKNARMTPSSVRLAPTESKEVQITGEPSGESVTLDVKGAFGTRKSLLAVQSVPSVEVLADIPADRTLRFVRQNAAADLSKSGGQLITDALATHGTAWAIRIGEVKPGYVLFGPYSATPKGRYLVLFRLKCTAPTSGAVATLDTCVGGGIQITSSRTIQAEDLPEGKYRSFGIVFDHPGGPMETRVSWPGTSDIVVDGVTLWEVVTN